MLIVLVGKSGSGKTVIVEEMKKLGYEKLVTYTTRPMRDGEIEGKDYFFLTMDEFDKREREGFFGEAVSYNTSNGLAKYGMSVESLTDKENKRVTILNPAGLEIIRQKGLNPYTVYLDVDENVILERLKKRGDDDKEIETRLRTDANDFERFESDVRINVKDNIMQPEVFAQTIAILGECNVKECSLKSEVGHFSKLD